MNITQYNLLKKGLQGLKRTHLNARINKEYDTVAKTMIAAKKYVDEIIRHKCVKYRDRLERKYYPIGSVL